MTSVHHALVGAAVAATVMKREIASGNRGASWFIVLCGGLVGNAPDMDVFGRSFCRLPYGLAYLLFHRGKTHTIVGALLLALIAAGLFRLIAHLLFRGKSPLSFVRLGVTCAAAALSHLALDWTNDYGAHPFYPLYNGWIYGDFIMLAEPLVGTSVLPLALRPLTFHCDEGRKYPAIMLLFVALGVPAWMGYCLYQHIWITPIPAAGVVVWTVAQMLVQQRRRSLLVPWLSMACVLVAFFTGSRVVKAETENLMAERFPNETLVHVTTTPAGSNPFCWRVITSSEDLRQRIITVRLGIRSLNPLSSPETCLRMLRTIAPTAHPDENDVPKQDGWHWIGRVQGLRKDFDDFAEVSCPVKETKRFYRAPFWREDKKGTIIFGDMRLDYQNDLDHYAKYSWERGRHEDCDFEAPPWISPFL